MQIGAVTATHEIKVTVALHGAPRTETNHYLMHIRDYTPTDRPACLDIFAGNTPDFFLPEEEEQFAGFLDRLPGPYLIVADGASVLACGGYAIDAAAGMASLCWGMVLRSRHRQGVGRALLRARLARIAEHDDVQMIQLDTSQHTSRFFENEGFTVREVVPDGYGSGLHRCEMELILDDSCRAELRRRWDEHSRSWR